MLRTITHSLLICLFLISGPLSVANAVNEQASRTYRVGFVGCLSGLAASWGTSVLEGVQLAISEEQGAKIDLAVEDDESNVNRTMTAYKKLRSTGDLDVLISGSWWANAIVKTVEREKFPLLSVETSYNKDAVLANNYFLLSGNLKDWISAFEPVIKERGFKSGSIIRFISGFGETLAEGMEQTFSVPGRSFVSKLEYSDLTVMQASSLLLKTKSAHPDVVYFDVAPVGLASLLMKREELKMQNIAVFTNSSMEDVCNQKMIDCKALTDIYYTARKPIGENFRSAFTEKYGRAPNLEADIGYYALKLFLSVASEKDRVAALKKKKLDVDTFQLSFDEKNVLLGLQYDVHALQAGKNTVVSTYSR